MKNTQGKEQEWSGGHRKGKLGAVVRPAGGK
jgi:hypothetical protein